MKIGRKKKCYQSGAPYLSWNARNEKQERDKNCPSSLCLRLLPFTNLLPKLTVPLRNTCLILCPSCCATSGLSKQRPFVVVMCFSAPMATSMRSSVSWELNIWAGVGPCLPRRLTSWLFPNSKNPGESFFYFNIVNSDQSRLLLEKIRPHCFNCLKQHAPKTH